MVVGACLGVFFTSLSTRLALVPRSLSGLVGIFTAPFIHANFAHLAANLPSFLVLGLLLVERDAAHFLQLAVAIAIGQGVLLWFFGRKAAHVGMSGEIFGFFGYLLALGWYSHTTHDFTTALVVLLFYGGMLAGVAPTRNGTSWEGHLFGLIAGLGTAWFQFGR